MKTKKQIEAYKRRIRARMKIEKDRDRYYVWFGYMQAFRWLEGGY
jgi:hypothetical protein